MPLWPFSTSLRANSLFCERQEKVRSRAVRGENAYSWGWTSPGIANHKFWQGFSQCLEFVCHAGVCGFKLFSPPHPNYKRKTCYASPQGLVYGFCDLMPFLGLTHPLNVRMFPCVCEGACVSAQIFLITVSRPTIPEAKS